MYQEEIEEIIAKEVAERVQKVLAAAFGALPPHASGELDAIGSRRAEKDNGKDEQPEKDWTEIEVSGSTGKRKWGYDNVDKAADLLRNNLGHLPKMFTPDDVVVLMQGLLPNLNVNKTMADQLCQSCGDRSQRKIITNVGRGQWRAVEKVEEQV